MEMKDSKKSIFADAIRQSFKKLSPRVQVKNPVMLVVYLGAIMTSGFYVLSFLESAMKGPVIPFPSH